MRVDWRRALIYTHRWLGITGGLVFLLWFISGIVMMYQRMPRLTAEERLVRLPTLDVSSVQVAPVDAARAAGVTTERFRIGMFGSRPVYRFLGEGAWTTVFADTGEPLQGLSDREALDIVRRFVASHPSTVHYTKYLTSPDQWLLDGGCGTLS